MPPPGYKLYFIAIVPPAPIRDEAWALKEYFRDRYQSKASLNSPPHITLHMPFQWKTHKEAELIQSLQEFFSTQQQFTLALQNFSAFEPRVIFIDVPPNDALMTMQQDLMRFCKANLNLFHAQYRDLPYHPHLTLAFRDLKKTAFAQAWQEFQNKIFQREFRAERVTLLKHDGKQWNELAHFSLHS